MKVKERYEIKMMLGTSTVPSGKFDEVCTASCTCKAGRGPKASCKHVAAVCYGLEEFSRRGIFRGVTSSTSDLQKWNAPSAKRLSKDLTFSTPSFDRSST